MPRMARHNLDDNPQATRGGYMVQLAAMKIMVTLFR